MKKLPLIFIILPFIVYSQSPSFYFNEGLINDNAIFIESKNWMICFPNAASSGILVGEKISIWDVSNGIVLKNISLGNRTVRGIQLTYSEKYFVIEFNDAFEIYETRSLNRIRAISRDPNFESFCYISERLDVAFVPDGLTTTKYSLIKSEDKGEAMKTRIGFYDWTKERINGDSLLIRRGDTVQIVSLTKDIAKDILYEKELLGNHETYYSCHYVSFAARGNTLLISLTGFANKKKILLWDIASRQVLSESNFDFMDHYYYLSVDKSKLLIFSNSYVPENMKGGYQFLAVAVKDNKLTAVKEHFQNLDSLNSFSVSDYTWKHGIFTLRCHNKKTVYIYNTSNNRQFSVFCEDVLPKVDVLDENLVLIQDQDLTSTRIFHLPSEKVLVINNAKWRSYSFSNELRKNKINFYTREKNHTYSFYRIKNTEDLTKLYSFFNISSKISPSLKSKIAESIRCELYFKGESSSEALNINPVLGRKNELLFNLSSGAVEFVQSNSFLSGSQPISGNNVYCKFSNSPKRNIFGQLEIDSAYFYESRTNNIIAKCTPNRLAKLAHAYIPSISFIASNSASDKLLVHNGIDSIYQLQILDKKLKSFNAVKYETYPSHLIGYCNRDKNIYQIGNSELVIYDASTGSRIRSIAGNFASQGISVVDSKYVSVDSHRRIVILGDFVEGSSKPIKWNNQQWIFNSVISGVSKYSAVAFSFEGTGDLSIFNTNSGKEIYHANKKYSSPGAFLDSDHFLYFNPSGLPEEVNFKNGRTNTFISAISVGPPEDFYFSESDNLLLSTSTNNLYIWDIPGRKLLYNLIVADSSHYFLQNNEGYYSYDKIEANQILCRLQSETTYPQQLDFIYNRPDLFALNPVTAKFLYQLYLQRLKYHKIKLGDLSRASILERPHCTLVSDNESNISETPYFQLRLRSSGKIKSRKVLVFVNSVPYLEAPIRYQISHDTTFSIELQTGANKIVSYYLGENGIESNYVEKTIIYQGGKNGEQEDVFFIGMGVGTYKHPGMNLRYSTKDIIFLDSLFRSKYGRHYFSLIFLDSALIKTKITTIKNWLRKTKVNDKVIIAASGHGLLNDSLKFFFATYNASAIDPEKGISYDELENLFHGIKARKRLLLLDACHSGEIDQTYQHRNKHSELTLEEELANSKAIVSSKLKTGGVGLQESFELMRSLFADPSFNNGTVILSAARGNQMANEGDAWNNGAFTYSIKQGLVKSLADLDHDHHISVSELKIYVILSVPQFTGGAQKPTLRRDQADLDWLIW